METKILETGVDKLVNLVRERGSIPLNDASKELGVNPTVILEWIAFLDTHCTIGVEYKLTTPYLIDRKHTGQEIDIRTKLFKSKREMFVRKAEVILNYFDNRQDELKNLKREFDALKDELGIELETVRLGMNELQEYKQRQEELYNEAQFKKNEAKTNINRLTNEILIEQERYQKFISEIKGQKDTLDRKNTEIQSVQKDLSKLYNKLAELSGSVVLVEKKVSYYDSFIKNSQDSIRKLSRTASELERKSTIDYYARLQHLRSCIEQEKRIVKIQKNIFKKIVENQKNISNSLEIAKKINSFFENKLLIPNLVDKLSKDRNKLRQRLIEFIKKAKTLEVAQKKEKVVSQIIDLEKEFEELNKNRSAFENGVRRLMLLLMDPK